MLPVVYHAHRCVLCLRDDKAWSNLLCSGLQHGHVLRRRLRGSSDHRWRVQPASGGDARRGQAQLAVAQLLAEARAARHATSGCHRRRTISGHVTRITRLPVVIVLVFAVCGSVSLLGFVLDAVYASMPETSGGDGGRYPRWLQMYTAVANCLVVFNAAVNFLLMLCFGHKFRRMLNDDDNTNAVITFRAIPFCLRLRLRLGIRRIGTTPCKQTSYFSRVLSGRMLNDVLHCRKSSWSLRPPASTTCVRPRRPRCRLRNSCDPDRTLPICARRSSDT